MDMLTYYGHIKEPKKNTVFFLILAWLCRFIPLGIKQDHGRFYSVSLATQITVIGNEMNTQIKQIWVIFIHLWLRI